MEFQVERFLIPSESLLTNESYDITCSIWYSDYSVSWSDKIIILHHKSIYSAPHNIKFQKTKIILVLIAGLTICDHDVISGENIRFEQCVFTFNNYKFSQEIKTQESLKSTNSFIPL